MKNLFKQITALVAVFAFATTAFAASVNNHSKDLPTLRTTTEQFSNGGWSGSTSVDANDVVSFAIYYHVTEGTASNLKVKLENLTGRTFKKGNNETVSASVFGSNVNTSNGAVNLKFNDNVKLNFYGTSWQANQCTKLACETPLKNGQGLTQVLKSAGLSLGNIDAGWPTQGSVVVYFKAVEVEDPVTPPSYDNCTINGVTVAHGSSKRFYSATQTEGQCSAIDQVRSCNDGNLSGSNTYRYTTCSTIDTPSNDEDVTTNSATSIDEDSARLNGKWDGDDNTDVWFAFSRTDSTPSCSVSSQKVGATNVDDNETFSEVVSNLFDNTTYYFRACAEKSNGSIDSGSIKSFVTDEEEDDSNNNNNDDVDVTTDAATNIDEDSARINGEMDGDDNVDVWFAFSRTDSTPSCNVSSQRVGETDADDGDDFSETVTNLFSNTTYYFRACAEDNDGSVVSGSIRDFTTDDEEDNNNNSEGNNDELRTVTNVASNITTSSARLNSIVLGEGNATCYFQYGRTTSLGLNSPLVSVDLDDDSTCSSTRTGLASNSTYYYRSVLIQDGETQYGAIRSFRTNQVFTTGGPTPVTSTPTPTNTNTTVTIVNQNVDVTEEGLSLTKWVSAEDDARFDDETEATPGETVYYKVRVTNTSGKDLSNVVVTDRIPFELELSENRSLDDDDDKRLTWVINLDEGESRTFITEMRLREDVREGDVITSFASAVAEDDDFSVNSNDVLIEVEEDAVVTAGQGANLFGAGFLPTTLMGWGLLLLVILAIAYFISRILVSRNENARVLAELKAARANG